MKRYSKLLLASSKHSITSIYDRLQAENREQVRGLEELTTLQQEQLEVQRREMAHLSSSVRSLQIQPREDTPQGSGQREVTV